MIVVYGKIGTGPGGYVRLKGIRKLPQVGQKVQFKRSDSNGVPLDSGVRWEGGIVDRIDPGSVPIHFISLF